MQFSLKQLLIGLSALAIVCAACVTFPWSDLLVDETKDEKRQQEMLPMIDAVDAFILENARAPTFSEARELEKSADRFATLLKSETRFIKKMGGTNPNDYILGIWIGEWHYCYQSWNKQYFHDYSGQLWGD
jgi:hypothetical protein